MNHVLPEKLTVTQLVKKFPHVLWNMKVHYWVYKNLPLNQTKLDSIFIHF